jgi:pimeloyl-ACP methyl ester carboxylesterase
MQVAVMPSAETDVTLTVTIDTPAGNQSKSGPTALIAHGAGSSGEFVRRAFGPPLLEAGWRLASYDLRGHGASSPVTDPDRLGLAEHVADLRAVAQVVGATLLGGVSMGAHAAVLAAVLAAAQPGGAPDPVGLLLALPAWTGAPEAVAAANALQAAELSAAGLPVVLERICRDHPGWVADELAESWPRHDPASFVAVLTALARSTAPTPDELRSVPVPVGLVALADDPMHPAAVAAYWAEAIPAARLVRIPFDAPAADRAVLGRAALDAWQRAGGVSPGRGATGSR